MTKLTLAIFMVLFSKILFANEVLPELTYDEAAEEVIQNDCYESVYQQYTNYYPEIFNENRTINFLTELPMTISEFYENFSMMGFDRLQEPTYNDPTLRALFGSTYIGSEELRYEAVLYSTESCNIVDVEIGAL